MAEESQIWKHGVDGYLEDTWRDSKRWDFKMEDIDLETGKKVFFHVGTADVNTPGWTNRGMHERVKGSRIFMYGGKTHYDTTASYPIEWQFLKERWKDQKWLEEQRERGFLG
ncbi:uncharacterized protein BDR25DRAFT_306206 [Lindgomyces ingoldianus]|uniref:Uncharacterized protein n=1 Tax=Lindgomyces ingoldianus TaxID=673940 RepID=A0ACB6QHP6_9PLEO|nr:uncharacterized protein BDR25DRAFT_306206 [Lindgomyces ingoldianus]KAF2466412.1 hypothetical protein BDR25DRAFT_306206 [Lindgomyces ingoldianus]